jgi:hypothetical protein
MIFKKMFFQLMMMRARENKTLISLPVYGIAFSNYVYQNFAHVFFFWNSSVCDVVDIALELNCLKLKHFKLAPFWL